MPPSGCPTTFLSFSDRFLSVKNWRFEIALHIQLFALNFFCSFGFRVTFCIHATFRLSYHIFVIFGQVFVGQKLKFWYCLIYSAVCPIDCCSLGFKVKFCIHATFRLSDHIFVIFGQVFVDQKLTLWDYLTYSAVCTQFILFFVFQGKISYACHLQAVRPYFCHFRTVFLSVKNWRFEIALHIQLFALNFFCSLGFKVKFCIHATFRLSTHIFWCHFIPK